MEEIVREEVLEDVGLDTKAIDTEVGNIVERLEDISRQELSNEEKLEAIDNTDVSGIPTEINQSVGVYDREDPYSGEAKNTPEAIAQSNIVGQDTVYKDLPQPTIASTAVNVDDIINEEAYGGEYGEAVSEGIAGDITKQVVEVTSEVKEVYEGEDGCSFDCNEEEGSPEVGVETVEVEESEIKVEEDEPMANGIVDDINKASSTEAEDEEVVETPEELEDEVTEEETTEEVVEEEEEVEVDETSEETIEEYESEEEVVEEAVEEGSVEGEVVASVEITEGYGAAHVLDELEGELRDEVEAIELVDNANTKMFDGISFMKDLDFNEDVNPVEDGPEAVAALVTDGVGLQEGFDGETVPATGGASEGETVESYEEEGTEEVTEIENVAATESLGYNAGYTGTRGPVSSRNVLSKFWNGK